MVNTLTNINNTSHLKWLTQKWDPNLPLLIPDNWIFSGNEIEMSKFSRSYKLLKCIFFQLSCLTWFHNYTILKYYYLHIKIMDYYGYWALTNQFQIVFYAG